MLLRLLVQFYLIINILILSYICAIFISMEENSITGRAMYDITLQQPKTSQQKKYDKYQAKEEEWKRNSAKSAN